MNLDILAAAPAQMLVHLFAAILAFATGSIILMRPKGTISHKRLGWIFVVLMTVTATSAIFIRRTEGIPNIAGFTPIHFFIVLTAIVLPSAIIHIRNGRVEKHAASMIGLYIGALIVAGALAFMPGRRLHAILFGG